ncbi:Uncharacterised protein [Vibrio cholerae]|nr:Uncharacterised protein [Vibrio cholerae]
MFTSEIEEVDALITRRQLAGELLHSDFITRFDLIVTVLIHLLFVTDHFLFFEFRVSTEVFHRLHQHLVLLFGV